MKISILLRTSDYRGDHAADVLIAYDPIPGETIEQLVERLLGDRRAHDLIEIRQVVT